MKLLVLLAVIGVAVADTLPYIIGGNFVSSASKYPWQGSLQKSGRHSCGLSLISTYWAVTAAHCVGGGVTGYSFDFGTVYHAIPGKTAYASNIIIHESYGSGAGSFPNDIALVQFTSAVSGTNIQAIPMAASGSEHAGNTDCYITGWGVTTVGGGSVSSQLKEAKINVYTNSVCKSYWGSSINNGHVCIGDRTNERGSCNGDSGGPLVCKVGGRYELVGATSWGVNGCSPSYYPSVYSRIGYFREWIRTKTGGL